MAGHTPWRELKAAVDAKRLQRARTDLIRCFAAMVARPARRPVSRAHDDDPDCWREPVLAYLGPAGERVWVHRDLEGGTMPPPDIIAQAIVECLMDDEE